MFKRRAKINDKSFSRDPLQLKSRGGTAVPALRRADVLRGMLADLRNQEIERLKSLVHHPAKSILDRARCHQTLLKFKKPKNST